MMYCPKCGSQNENDAQFCGKCGASFSNASVSANGAAHSASRINASVESRAMPQGSTITTVNIQTPQADKNPLGVAGFILALIGVFVSWVPVLGWIIWILGALLSLIGLFKKPKGMAMAGVILSFIDLILLLFVVASCSAITDGVVAAGLF